LGKLAMRREKIAVVTILAAVILAAICYLPAMAQDSGSITITMNVGPCKTLC